MVTKITIEKKPFEGSCKNDVAIFDTNETTEEGIIAEFSRVVKELGWFEGQVITFDCTGEFSKCGITTAQKAE